MQMVSKYGNEFSVPQEFPSVLKAFTREILRSQPGNIYEFGAAYFSELCAQRDAMEAQEAAAGVEYEGSSATEYEDGSLAEYELEGEGLLPPREYESGEERGSSASAASYSYVM